MSETPYTTDTSPDAAAYQFELLRAMTPTERVNKALALSSEVARQCKAAIRRHHPELDEYEVSLKFIELNYGKELSDAVRADRASRSNPLDCR